MKVCQETKKYPISSQLKFAPEAIPSGKMAIRYGLAAIKNVGEGAMRTSIQEREGNGDFESLDDFSNRLDSKSVNKRILENLVKAGAMDWTGEHRAGMFDRIELHTILKQHLGSTPVEIHLQSGTGKRATIEAGESLRIKKCASLSESLAEWME